jgi:hypothetical protein
VLLPLSLILDVGVAPCASAAEAAARVVVAVDRSAGLGLDGDDVRRAISDEIHAPVVAPSDGAAAGAASILVVSADKGTIRMVLRSNHVAATTRTIPASPDRSVRLREIGRLAGDLLRDQPTPEPTQEIAPAPAPAPAAVRSESAPAPPVESLAAASAAPPGSPPPEWIVAAFGGPTMAVDAGATLAFAASYQLEVQRRAAPGALAVGLALQIGTGTAGYGRHVYGTLAEQYGEHVFGLDGFVAKEWRGTRWFIDTAAGAGLEEAYTTSSPGILGIIPTGGHTHTTPVPDMLLFVRGTSTAGVAVTSRLDVVVRLTAHLSPHGFETSFVGAAAGLRLRVP